MVGVHYGNQQSHEAFHINKLVTDTQTDIEISQFIPMQSNWHHVNTGLSGS